MEKLVLIEEGPFHRVGSWRNVTVCVMREQVTVAAMAATARAHRQVLAHHPEGVLSFTLGEPGIGVPPLAVQSEAARVTREAKPTLRGSVAVVEGEGFWVSAVRGVITGIMLLVPGAKIIFETDLTRAISALQKLAAEGSEWSAEFATVVQEARRFSGPSA